MCMGCVRLLKRIQSGKEERNKHGLLYDYELSLQSLLRQT